MWRRSIGLAGAVALVLTSLVRPNAQSAPLPVIDMHMHALAADAQGPPPLGMCVGEASGIRWDQRTAWPEAFLAWFKKPPCAAPVWSPKTDDALREETLAVLRRRNIVGVASGPPEFVARWHAAAPDRVIRGIEFTLGTSRLTPDQLRESHANGEIAVLAEVGNQYAGVAADDPAFEPYLAVAEQNDIPLGIHIGTGPPGAPYLGFERYRARLHSPLQLEDALIKHPKLRVYVMHAGWPMLDDMLAVMWAHPQVHVDLGVIIFALPQAEFYRYLQRMVDAGFGSRVMFGSDQMVWPGVIEPAIKRIEDARFLTVQQKRDILYNNAARFLRLTKVEIDRHHGRSGSVERQHQRLTRR